MGKTGKAARVFGRVLLTVAATPALVAVLEGTKGDDVLVGTNVRVQMNGRGGGRHDLRPPRQRQPADGRVRGRHH